MDLSVSAEQWNAECLLTDSQEITGKVKQGLLSTFIDDVEGVEVVLIIPADKALLVSVHLPGKNATRLKQALPYALEDQLIAAGPSGLREDPFVHLRESFHDFLLHYPRKVLF